MTRSSFFDPMLARIAGTHARWQFNRFMRAAHNAAAVQDQLLAQWLARHTAGDMGRELKFASIKTYREFASRVPIRTYEELWPYVQQVMRGRVQALFSPGERVLMFATTSGTTDTPKYIPVTPRFLQEYRRGWNVFGLKALLDHPAAVLRPILQVASADRPEQTAMGVPCGSISSLLAATQKKLVRKYYVIPPEVARIEDADTRYYTIMRLAMPRDVSWIVTASPATPLRLARTALDNAELLIRDIRDGTLTVGTEIPAEADRAISPLLMPQPAVAKSLSAILERCGELHPQHYWRLSLLANWTGGTLGLHLDEFPRFFGDTPVRDIGLLATEGRVTIPLEDGTPAGVLDVPGSFFEFIDANVEPDRPPPADCVLRCHELVPGSEYRVVMTAWSGLPRYDLGDYVRVHGFVGQAPVLEFLHRGAHVSSITGEKLTEWQATQAFTEVCRTLGIIPCSFVLAPVWDDPPYYRLYLDTECTRADHIADRLNDTLARLNMEYAYRRSSGRLGPIRVGRLAPGALAELDAQLAAHSAGSANEQFKHKFLYTRPGEDAHLHARVIREARV